MVRVRVIGVDQSLSCTGIVVLEAESKSSASPFTIETLYEETVKTETGPHHFLRSDVIARNVERVCMKFDPHGAAIESPAFARGTMLASLGGLHFLILNTVLSYPSVRLLANPDPSKIKFWATRSLIADRKFGSLTEDEMFSGKDGVKMAYRERRGLDADTKVNDNVADAWFIAEFGAVAMLVLETRAGDFSDHGVGLTEYEQRVMTDHRKAKGVPKGFVRREGRSWMTKKNLTDVCAKVKVIYD